MPTIDSDAHVVETPETWEYLDPSEKHLRPVLVQPDGAGRLFWFIDGKLRGHTAANVITEEDMVALGEASGRNMATPQEARFMSDIQARLRHMDELGIDVQVLYPTIFIQQVTERAEVEVPLCKAYNRWLADIWRQGKGRLRWVAVLPLLSMPDALDMLPWCKEHGAVAVFVRPVEGWRLMHDPYFYPLYEAASKHDLAIGVHVSNANPLLFDMVRQRINWAGGFWSTCLPTAGACHAIISSGLPKLFPELRIGFIEASASWVPWVIKDLRRRPNAKTILPENIFEDYRLYTTCYTSDDIEHVAKYSGENNLLIGTDYGHDDMSAEVDALKVPEQNGDVRRELVHKILDDNARRFYGL